MTIYAWHTYVWRGGDDGRPKTSTTALARIEAKPALIDPEWKGPQPFIRRWLSEDEFFVQLKHWPHWSSAKPSGEWSMLTPEGVEVLSRHLPKPTKTPVVTRHR